jgi:hypothetical protein
MKAVFTCDDVFDVLTRKPFPSGDTDDEIVESHLAVCHECRQLAEAFRPAVGLFHESMSAEIDDKLPSYRGRLQPLSIVRSDKSVDRLQRKKRLASSPLLLAVVASLLLVVAAIVGLQQSQRPESSHPNIASTGLLRADRDYTLLAALEIPGDCGTRTEFVRLKAVDFICCTKCHRANSRVVSTKRAFLKTSVACAACHQSPAHDPLSLVRQWTRASTCLGTTI